MIHPTVQVTEEIYIHAACEAIWARFIRLDEWPRWRSDVSRASWVQGQTWQEGAQFTLHKAGGGSSTYLIRMVVPANTSVWESNTAGNTMDPGAVYSIHFAEQVGGCKVSLRCTFHGWGALLKRVTAAREKAKLHAPLAELKAVMERGRER